MPLSALGAALSLLVASSTDPSLYLDGFVGGSIPLGSLMSGPVPFGGLMGGPGCSAGPSATTCDQRQGRHHFRADEEQPEIGQHLPLWLW